MHSEWALWILVVLVFWLGFDIKLGPRSIFREVQHLSDQVEALHKNFVAEQKQKLRDDKG